MGRRHYRRIASPACTRTSSRADRLWRRAMPVLARPTCFVGAALISIACACLIPVGIINGSIALAVGGFVACSLFAFVAELGIDCLRELTAPANGDGSSRIQR